VVGGVGNGGRAAERVAGAELLVGHRMLLLIVIGFLGGGALILWTTVVILAESRARPLRAVCYVVALVAVGIAAIVSTYNYDYFPNANTHIFGWPIPVVIFQRDSATGPWMDFIGPTVVLGLPMNFILFMLVPAIAFLTEATWHRWRFSLRALLIATTLIAIVLGLLAVAIR
jgi:hypothetical protein